MGTTDRGGIARFLIAGLALSSLAAGSRIDAPQSSPAATTLGVLGGNSCSTPTSCEFMGLQNTATGNATLQIVSGNLVISNIDAGGDDGVDIIAPAGFTGHEEIIILGTVGHTQPSTGATATGTKTTATGLAQTFGPPVSYRLDVEDIGTQVRITTDFTASNATSLRYVVRRVHVVQADVPGQPLSSAVVAGAWPYRESLSLVEWPTAVQIQLPGGTTVQGDELEIIPVGATVHPQQAEMLAYRVTNAGGLATFTITEEFFIVRSVPGWSWWAAAATIAGTLLAAGWAFWRRAR